MEKGQIVSDKVKLMDIFSKEFWFVIPEYQRSYVWENDNIMELMDDLVFAYENKPDNEYFLGSLVLKKVENKEYPEYEVLDGQQRLTTFFIMMAVLRDLVEEVDFKNTIHSKIYQKKDILQKIPERSRITYKIRDNIDEFIKSYIIEENGTSKEEELKEKLKEYKNISVLHMANAILILRKELSKIENLPDFIAYIFDKALFIYVSTSNTEDAFRMFTILNDRGIPLTSADILKSENIGALNSDKEKQKYAQLWEDIEAKYGDGFDRFLQFIRTILVKEKARANLLDEFKEKVYDKKVLMRGKETFDLVEEYSDIYEKIIDLQDSSLSNKFKNLITIMKIGLRSEDWIPPLLSYFEKFKYKNLDEFLTKLEYKFAGDWICGITPTKRLDAMNNILKKIGNCSNSEEVLEDENIFNINKEELKNSISGDIYQKQFSKYVLLKLEYLMSDNTVHLSSFNCISVEHVLPQNPKNDSEWNKIFTKDERAKWTNKLGNLVLISKRKNSSLGNCDFKEKKEKYLKSRIDAFNGSKVFIESNDKWTVDVLQDRQAKNIKMLVDNKYV